jgi:hypothetical protein
MSDQQIVVYIFIAGLILPYLAVALMRWRRRSQELRAPEFKQENNYSDLRAQALHYKCPHSNADASSPETPAHPCAVVMDWAVSSAIATIVAISDGTASMYYSTGGGTIGGAYARPAIREAAQYAVSIAGKFLPSMLLTDDFPLPEKGGVIFYIVTNKGVFMAKASVDLLSANRHPLSELGNSMQNIITQYRHLDALGQ